MHAQVPRNTLDPINGTCPLHLTLPAEYRTTLRAPLSNIAIPPPPPTHSPHYADRLPPGNTFRIAVTRERGARARARGSCLPPAVALATPMLRSPPPPPNAPRARARRWNGRGVGTGHPSVAQASALVMHLRPTGGLLRLARGGGSPRGRVTLANGVQTPPSTPDSGSKRALLEPTKEGPNGPQPSLPL